MPSGNFQFAYTGDEESITLQDQTFPAGEAQHVTDNGLASYLRTRDDFAEDGAEPKPRKPGKAKA